MINLEWYRSFTAIYRLGTVSKAAEACFLSQPAVSQHLAALEHALGKKLFTRTSRRMLPTEAGKSLYVQTAPSLDRLEQLTQKVETANRPAAARIRLGAPFEYFYECVVPQLANAPLQLKVEFDVANRLVQKLEHGDLDCIIATQQIPARIIEYRHLVDETFVIVASRYHADIPPMQGPYSAILEQWLLNQDWISYGADLPIIRRFWQIVFCHRPEIQPRYVVPNLHVVVKMIQSGYGLSVLPEYLFNAHQKSAALQAIRFPEAVVSNDLFFAYRTTDRQNLSIQQIYQLLRPQPNNGK